MAAEGHQAAESNMNIKIHTQSWTGSRPAKTGERPGAAFGGFLEIDGQVYDRVNDIHVSMGDEFAAVTVTLIPGSVEIINHTEETWSSIAQKAVAREIQAAARTGDGRTIAIYVSPENKEK